MSHQQFTVHNLSELQALAEFLATEYLNKYKKIFFYGEMGAGKTTFIKLLCEQLGVTESTGSPTFALVRQYPIPNSQLVINHADLYRLRDSDEAFNAGLYELFFDEDYFFVEWPEKVETFADENVLKVTIEAGENEERYIEIKKIEK
jgi:tRNA threonylcarbamoyladenosine biosynthesis protein TsaE